MIRGMYTGEMILEKWALFVTPVGTSRNARDRKSLAIYFPGRGGGSFEHVILSSTFPVVDVPRKTFQSALFTGCFPSKVISTPITLPFSRHVTPQ